MRLRRVLWLLASLANPGARFVIGAWAILCFALGVALVYRSPLEQFTGWGFIAAGAALVAAFPRREMHLAFVGFGVAATAALARTLSFVAVADNWAGAVIILVAWGTVAGGLLQRALASLEVLLITQEEQL